MTTTLRDIMETITLSINSIETILDDVDYKDMAKYDAEFLDLIEGLLEAVDNLKNVRRNLKDLDEKNHMLDLIDHVLSIVVDHPGISTAEVGRMANVDLMEVTGMLIRLWSRHKIEGKIEPNGVICWYGPEYWEGKA